MNRTDFRKLSIVRLREAKSLLNNKFPCGAYYLAGYSIECALKACVANKTKKYDFPDKNVAKDAWTHDFVTLVKTAGLQNNLDDEKRNNPQFEDAWKTIVDWKEDKRYDNNITQAVAQGFIEAIINDSYGVLRWLKKYW